MTHADERDDLALARTGLDGDRRQLAAREVMSLDVAKMLLKKGDDDTLFALARNPATPRPVLRKLRRATQSGALGLLLRRPVPKAALLRAFATNPALPERWLRELARHVRWDVRAAALCNPAMPKRVLQGCLRDEIWGVCSIVAESSTDADILRMLATHTHPGVRAAVVANPAAPPDAVDAARAADAASTDVDDALSPDWQVRAACAARQTSAWATERFAVDPHPRVRLAALDAAIRVHLIHELTDDADFDVSERAFAELEKLPPSARNPRRRSVRGLFATRGAGRSPTPPTEGRSGPSTRRPREARPRTR